MALQTIPGLTPALSVNGAEEFWVAQGGADVRITTAQLVFYLLSVIAQPTGVQPLVAQTLTATGTNQGTALPISALTNFFTTVANGTGAVLAVPTNVYALGLRITFYNDGANALSVYPNSGAQIDGDGADVPVVWGPGAHATYICETASGGGFQTPTAWRSL